MDRTGRTLTISPNDVAIVGIGCLFPKAHGAGHFWANIKRGVDGISDVPPTHWNPADYYDSDPKAPDMTYARRGGFLEAVDFNPMDFGIAPRDLEATDTTQLLGLVAAKQALQDAGVVFLGSEESQSPDSQPARSANPEAFSTHTQEKRTEKKKPVSRDRVSVILGVTGTLELVVPLGARLGHPHWRKALKESGVPDDVANDVVNRISDSYVAWQENSFPGLLGNVVAGRIANRLDLHGTNCVVDAACASSLSAVHLAMMELQTGKADVVVTGGADTFNDIFMFMCFSKTPALSPTGNSKPFDANGDGTILGEGIGMVVLKRRSDAVRDGDTIYAVIKSVGTSSDGKGNAIYAPSADGQIRCIRNAHKLAEVTPDTIELIEAHGTGTKVGDGVEAKALSEVFRHDAKNAPATPWCALGSVKSQIGHTKAAAGAAGLIKAALSLYHKVLPPTIKVANPVEPLREVDSPFYVNTTARPWLPRPGHPRRAGLSAFGFGGSNFHAILEEHDELKAAPDWDGQIEIVAVAGNTHSELIQQLKKLPTEGDAFTSAAAESRAKFQSSSTCRMTIVIDRSQPIGPIIESAIQQLQSKDTGHSWTGDHGISFGHGPMAGQFAVLFPGQGSQRVGMLREFVTLFPEALDAFSAADVLTGPGEKRISDLVYPPTSFDSGSIERQKADLTRTDRAQIGLAAAEFAAWRVLRQRFRISPDVFAGHSFGELTALAAAGRIAPVDFFRLAHLRGRLMAETVTGEATGMTALMADAERVGTLLGAYPNLVIANRNGPKQTVVSGPVRDLDSLEEIARQQKMAAIRLNVAAAFHSPTVAAAVQPFFDAVNKTTFSPTKSTVYANTTAASYPDEPDSARQLIGYQLVNPVRFDEQIRAMIKSGVRLFLEVGPGGTLSKMASLIAATATPPGEEITCLAIEPSDGKKSGILEFAHVLARLSAAGLPVDLSAWQREYPRPPANTTKMGLTVKICGANLKPSKPSRPIRPATKSSGGGTDPMNRPADGETLSPLQEALVALQRMQEVTATLHKQFLDSQLAAQQTIASLMAGGRPAVLTPIAPVAAPLPPLPTSTYSKAAPTAGPTQQSENRIPARAAIPAGQLNSPDVSDVLLSVVSEKTGYPIETLDLGMSLDGDLGVDSIKRVEILSAIQDRLPNAPVVKPEQLGTLQTLRDVANYLSGPSLTGTNAKSGKVPTDQSASTQAARQSNLGSLTAAVQGVKADDVLSVLMAVVSEKTGYPIETLDPSMSMDNDLGIDSIKRVEILSAIQDRLPHAPIVKPEQLGTIQTLKDLAAFLNGTPNPATAKIPLQPSDLVTSTSAPPTLKTIPKLAESELTAPATEQVPIPMARKATDSIMSAAARESGRPAKTADPEPYKSLTQFAESNPIDRSILQTIDLDTHHPRPRLAIPSGRDAIVVSDDSTVTRELIQQIEAAGLSVALRPWNQATTAEISDSASLLVLIAPNRPPSDGSLNRLAFHWIQRAGSRIRANASATIPAGIISVTAYDGAFGLTGMSPLADAQSGGFAGMIKTVRHEWPEVAAKAIDVDPAFIASDTSSAAAAIAEECLTVGPIEIGISQTHRCTIELARTINRVSGIPMALGPNDVILVTGGARGVTAEATVALAAASKGTLILTGRTPLSTGPEPDWVAGITDEQAMKKAIADHIGPGATPKAVADLYGKTISQREIRDTISRVEAAGGKAFYHAVNVSNGRAVADLLHQIRIKHGKITILVHGAGILADKRIEQLSVDQFDIVYNTKAEGARLLLDLLRGEDLKAIVLFASTTARIGRIGQFAYAAANEVLNKLAQIESRKRPNARVVSINWGPWEGGMVTPALRRIFESEGVGLVPLADGGQFVVQELSATGRSVEVVAMGRLRGSSSIHTTPAPISRVGITTTPTAQGPQPSATPTPELAVSFERIVDVTSHPVLRSHVLDGRAVLPMAIHLEWLVHAAMHGNPGLQFMGLDNLRITSGVQIDADGAATLRALAGRASKTEKHYVVPVEIRGRRKDGKDVIHSRADVLLTESLPRAPLPEPTPALQPYPHPVDEVYKYFLFHGPDLQGIDRIEGLTELAIVGTAFAAPSPVVWFAQPLRSNWVADPLVLDSCFQMLILWSFAQHGAGSLPCFAGRYRQYRRQFPTGPIKVVARITRDNGTFARADIEFLDPDGQVIAQIQDYECVIDAQLNMSFRRNQLAGGLARV